MAPSMQAQYFNGRSARAQPVRLSIEAGMLRAAADATTSETSGSEPATWQWPVARLVWPERTRYGQRVIELPDGGTLVVADVSAFDAWRAQHGPREGLVARAQQRWRLVALSVLLTVVVVAAGYRWGVPALASGVVALVSAEAETELGDAVLSKLDDDWFEPSKLSVEQQRAWVQRFESMLDAALPPPAPRAAVQLHFRRGGDKLGANALALPGGHIIITDEMLELLSGHNDTVLGVLAHEYGHVEHRHGLHALARFALVSLAVSATLGDFSSVIAAVPVLLAQAGYSRDAEREADAVSARLLRASGRSPAVMVMLFELLQQQNAKPAEGGASAPHRARIQPPIALASHPHDEERVHFFREAAR